MVQYYPKEDAIRDLMQVSLSRAEAQEVLEGNEQTGGRIFRAVQKRCRVTRERELGMEKIREAHPVKE